jgi:anti-sigma regulatory factor (Ser/Thr protein kinase)
MPIEPVTQETSGGEPGYALRVERTMQGLERLGPWVDDVAAGLALTKSAEYALRLCLEEAVANLVMHGVPGTGGDDVAMAVSATVGGLRLTVTDHCEAFDLRSVPPSSLTERSAGQVGGLGIHLIRQYARQIDYVRDGDANRLTVTIGG